MSRTHTYRLGSEWTGSPGSYRGYGRTHLLWHPSKPDLPGSSDAAVYAAAHDRCFNRRLGCVPVRHRPVTQLAP